MPRRTAARVWRWFGAPRYAGGYHLHAGVDILAPYGTPIYATFDGYATQNPNGLGGLAVEVHGGPGYTYNAHLSEYSEHSTGSVQAGDVIGTWATRATLRAVRRTTTSSSTRTRSRPAGRPVTTATP